MRRRAVVIAAEPAASSFEVTIDMASVSSGDLSRDDHLRSVDFFDVEPYPSAIYPVHCRDGKRHLGNGRRRADDEGRHHPVRLEVDYVGLATMSVSPPWR